MKTLNRFRRALRAFTLVELLVVMGIIAVLIGILLPVLAGVADRGRDIQCQSNLKQIIQAMHGYAAENRGHFPWGLINNRMLPGTWKPDSNPEAKGTTICWAALIGRHWNRNALWITTREERPLEDLRVMFPPALNCPDANEYRDHFVSYAMSLVAGASPYMDIHLGGDDPPPIGALLFPTKQNQMRNETAVLWDTAVLMGTEFEPQFRMGMDIDSQRIWLGAKTPQFRFYTIKDPLGRVPPFIYGANRPLRLNVANYVYYNREQLSEAERWPFQGNLRFRHRKQTTCNAAFSDGSVRQFTAKMNSDKSVRQHDAIRRYFMLKWPPGIPPDRDHPY